MSCGDNEELTYLSVSLYLLEPQKTSDYEHLDEIMQIIDQHSFDEIMLLWIKKYLPPSHCLIVYYLVWSIINLDDAWNTKTNLSYIPY